MGQLQDAFRDAAGEVANIKAQPSNRYWWLYGTIKAKNSNGTLDVAIDGVTIQQVKATVSCMMANVGDRVIVLKAGPLMTCVDVIATRDVATTAACVRSALGLQGLGAIDRYRLSCTKGGAGWVKLGAWNGSDDTNILILDMYWGNGYNGHASQNCHTRIFVKNGLQSTLSTTNAFGVTVYNDGTSVDTSKVDVYVGAYSHNGCNVFVYTPWTYSDGFYTVQLSGGTWEHISRNVSGTSDVKQDLQYCRGSFKAGSGLKVADDGTLSVDNGAYVRQTDGWNVLQVGRLCVCSTTWTAGNSYIKNAWGSSLLESTEELRPPNYPVTFSSLPASHVDYVGSDAVYQSSCLVERHSATASTTNAGGLWLVRPTGGAATIGHPRIAITAVGFV